MYTFKEHKAELLSDPKVREEYQALEVESALIQALVAARIQHGWTQQQLAERIGIKQEALARIERGKTNPTLATLGRVAAALGKHVVLH